MCGGGGFRERERRWGGDVFSVIVMYYDTSKINSLLSQHCIIYKSVVKILSVGIMHNSVLFANNIMLLPVLFSVNLAFITSLKCI